MGQKSVLTSLTPAVTIESILGNLQVKGWDRSEVLLRASADVPVKLEKLEDAVRLSCHGDCVVRLPHAAVIDVRLVQGNARFKLLEGQLKIDQVQGSLEMRDIGSAQVSGIHGNLLVKQVSDGLTVEHVHGSAIARDIQGKCAFQQVAGNLDLHDTEGDILASAGGNARVGLSLLVGQSYQIRAGGNLQCEVPEDASLRVQLSSDARRIQIKLSGEKTTLAEQSHQLTLGAGETAMSLTAGGKLSFACEEGDWADMDDFQEELDDAFTGFSEEIEQQISDQMETTIETQMEALNEQLSKLEAMLGKSGVSQQEAERVMHRAKQASEMANRRAQERMRRAQEKLGRKLEAAQRKAEFKMRAAERHAHGPRKQGWKFEWASPPTPPRPPAPPEHSSEEERLIILRMLEQKKISIADAEQLLAALEGKES